MRFTAISVGLILWSALLLADSHNVDFDSKTDFSAIKTFAVHEGKVNSQRPELNNTLLVKKLGDTIREELTAKGLKETADKPDLLVDYSITGTDYSIVERGQPPQNVQVGPGGRTIPIPATGPQSVRYSEGTLVIDLTKRDSSSLLWRGVYRGREKNDSRLAQKVPEYAKKLFEEYPQKSKK